MPESLTQNVAELLGRAPLGEAVSDVEFADLVDAVVDGVLDDLAARFGHAGAA